MPFGISAGAAALIGAGVSGAAAIGGSLLQAGAAKDASGKAIGAQQAALEQSRADLEPWRTTGGTANTRTADLLGLNGPDAATAAMTGFQTSPGYTWSLDQGIRAVDARAAADSGARGGAVEKAVQTFGTGLANQEFSDYYNRLFNLSQLGEKAAAGQSSASQSTGTGIAQTDLSLGSAQTSIYGNLGQGLGNTANQFAQNKLYQERYGLGGGGSPYGPTGYQDTTSGWIA